MYIADPMQMFQNLDPHTGNSSFYLTNYMPLNDGKRISVKENSVIALADPNEDLMSMYFNLIYSDDKSIDTDYGKFSPYLISDNPEPAASDRPAPNLKSIPLYFNYFTEWDPVSI